MLTRIREGTGAFLGSMAVVASARKIRDRQFMAFSTAWFPHFALLTLMMCTQSANAQNVFPPGTYSIDGFPVNCGHTITIVTPMIPDIAMAQPGRIMLNPMLAAYPTGVKLFVYAHECAHQFVGANEPAADAWAIKLGRAQGWLTLC